MAVRDCITHNILKDFLEIHATEMVNMLLTEWNWDDALMISEEEGRKEAAAEYAEQLRQARGQIRRLQEENRRLREA